jgi:two-component system, NarL family, invasion response regulator UvrY
MITVFLVDDHALVREVVKKHLQDIPDIQVVGDSGDAKQALETIRANPPDIVILDIDMPGLDGLAVTRRISHIKPTPKVIILTAHDLEPFPSQLLKAGAKSYLTKGVSVDEMVAAIHLTYQGGSYLPPKLAQRLLEKNLDGTAHELFKKLKPREMEIILMVCRGEKPVDIGKKLFLSTKTVNTYRYRILKKLGIRNDVELTNLALQHGLVDA